MAGLSSKYHFINPGDCEDVVHDTLVRIIENQAQLNLPENEEELFKYCMRAAFNKYLDKYRQQKRQGITVPLDETINLAYKPTPELKLISKIVRLHSLIADIPLTPYQKILLDCMLKGKKVRDIKKLLPGKGDNNISVSKHKLEKKLMAQKQSIMQKLTEHFAGEFLEEIPLKQ